MSTSKTKKLTAGIPIVDSSGTVSPVSVTELAKQIGKELGVQNAAYMAGGTQWIRIAKIGVSSALVFLTNIYQNVAPSPIILAITQGYFGVNSSVKLISGTPNLFDKVRLIAKDSVAFLEFHTSLEENKKNPWIIKMISASKVSVQDSTFNLPELYESLTPGEVPEGYTVKEFTVAELMGG